MTPEPGQYGVVRTTGWAPLLIRVVTRSKYNHAFIYVGGDTVVEARPSGAGYAALSSFDIVLWQTTALTQGQRDDIVAEAHRLVGTPYSWVDCAAIGLAKIFGWHLPEVVRKRLNRKDRLMCSQLVDTCDLRAGVHLFLDGRIPGDVSPGDLADLAS